MYLYALTLSGEGIHGSGGGTGSRIQIPAVWNNPWNIWRTGSLWIVVRMTFLMLAEVAEFLS